MKKTIIVSIPMTASIQKTVYTSNDRSLPASSKEFYYPVSALLAETIKPEDEIGVILITKHSEYSNSEDFAQIFVQELDEINKEHGADITISKIDSEFAEEKYVHDKLMAELADQIKTGSAITADVTFGPKDLPIVIFSALKFAERFLKCDIEHIIYGQGIFKDGKIIDTTICDFSPLYSLNSLTDTIKCDDPDKAKQILKTIVSL